MSEKAFTFELYENCVIIGDFEHPEQWLHNCQDEKCYPKIARNHRWMGRTICEDCGASIVEPEPLECDMRLNPSMKGHHV